MPPPPKPNDRLPPVPTPTGPIGRPDLGNLSIDPAAIVAADLKALRKRVDALEAQHAAQQAALAAAAAQVAALQQQADKTQALANLTLVSVNGIGARVDKLADAGGPVPFHTHTYLVSGALNPDGSQIPITNLTAKLQTSGPS